MHVYTMGTRAYAEKVCAAVDPDGSFFKGRILSRDESGSESILILFALPITDCCRHDTEEFTAIVPMRYLHGCYY